MKKVNIDVSTLEYTINTYPLKKDACKTLGISIDTLRRLVNEAGLSYPRTSKYKGLSKDGKYSFVDESWMKTHWINTSKSLNELSQEFNIPEGVLEYRRAKYNLFKPFKHTLNIGRFMDLSDPHIWYVAGLSATDGYLPKDQDSLEIDLTGESENKLLLEIASYYNSSAQPVGYGKTHRLRFAFKGLDDYMFKSFNIHSGPKTFDVDVPKSITNEDCAKAYFLGCFDGDGSISKSSYSVSLTTASELFVQGLSELYRRYTGTCIPVHMTLSDGKYYPTLSCTDKKARCFLEWMYSIIDRSFYLDRKYLNYRHVDDIVCSTSKAK